VTVLGHEHVDDLPELVHRPVEAPPPAGHLHVGLVDEPPITRSVAARAGGVREQRRESLHPPVYGDVIDVHTPLGQQLLHVPIGESVPEVPPDRNRDHLRREPEPSER